MARQKKPVHPGTVLYEEYMKPRGIKQARLAEEIRIYASTINGIVLGKRNISCDTALRLAKYFKTTPEFWLDLQNQYNLFEKKKKIAEDYAAIKPIK
ncbi:MAG: HigA family addiction module antitoxin [Planctomycetia bacterium]|nr:HigA family addiction module antitoxin [Planctomycetia bacterium]